jgi:hypothetical protein
MEIGDMGLHGLTVLFIEPLRADTFVVSYGVRANQLCRLGLLMIALWWLRRLNR